MVLFIFAIFLIAFVSLIMGYASIFYAGSLCLLVCYFIAFALPKKERKQAINLVGIVFCLYWISSAIISTSFENGHMFYVRDPSEYYATYKTILSFSWSTYIDNLSDLYLTYKDNNALYNTLMAWFAYHGNVTMGGANMMYYTVFHLFFGLLASLAGYRILTTLEDDRKALKHALIFSLISLFHVYSCVCVRDIWIAAFFLWAFVIVVRPPSNRGLLWLLLLFLLTTGTRIYSGLFFLVIIAFYIYKMAQVSRFKGLYYVFMAIVGVAAITSAAGALLLEQTMGDMDNLYEEIEGYGVSGLSAYIIHLPHGIKEIVMVFYSQIMPFPPFVWFKEATTFPHFYNSVLVLFYGLFSYFVFYGLLYMLFIKKKYSFLNVVDWALLLISLGLIMANSSQMDIRRVMPSFFVFYFLYLKISRNMPMAKVKRMNRILAVGYGSMLLVYVFIKGF